MSDIPSAFPYGQISETTGQPINGCFSPGMDLRDWFAGQALAGWMATYGDTPEHPATLESSDTVYAENIAQSSYLIADAMIKAREAKP